MSYLAQPVVRVIDTAKKHHALTFGFTWDDETVGLVGVGGQSIAASSFVLNPQGLAGAANLGIFRSLRFSESFANNPLLDPDANDGSLYVISQASGEVTRFSPFIPPVPIDRCYPTVSGVIPLVSALQGPIQFVKGAQQQNTFGMLTVTLYDFEIPPFIQSGFSNVE